MYYDRDENDIYYWHDISVNLCVCCGRVIPEGRQVCIGCEREVSGSTNDDVKKGQQVKSEKYTQMRKWLGRYQFILKEINARREHLEDFKNDIYNPLKAHIISLPNKSGISDTTLSRVINIRRIFGKMIDEMSLEIKRLHKAKEEIEAAISRLEGAERCIIYHRYILGIMWADMPEYVGYEARSAIDRGKGDKNF